MLFANQSSVEHLSTIHFAALVKCVLRTFISSNMTTATVVFVLLSGLLVPIVKQQLELPWHVFNLLLFVLGPLLVVVYRTYIYSNFFSPLRHLPQPRGGLPLIGHDLAQFQQPPAQDFGRWMQDVPNDGLVLPPPLEAFQ